MIHEELTAEFYEPSRKKPCVCGSGVKFKSCCSGNYTSKSLDQFRKEYNSGNYKTALMHARHHFTWYALSHKAHTIQLLKINKDAGENLLNIDIEALAELLENIYLCYSKLDKSEEFLDVIENARNIISDKRWDAKIAYARGLWYLVNKHDTKAAFLELELIDIQTCNDPSVLSLYIDVYPKELTLTESINIIDRIISNTLKESVRLQYRVLKAIKYYLVCQNKDGKKFFDEAISKFTGLSEDEKSSYGKLQLAYAMETYASLENSKDFLKDAREIATSLIDEAEEKKYKKEYFADLHKLLGDCAAGLGDNETAIKEYTFSLQQSSSQLTKVFLARSLNNNGEYDNARDVLVSINDEEFDTQEMFDLAITWAIIATTSLGKNDLEEAKHRLKNVKSKDPLFIQYRDSWIIELLEITPKTKPGKLKSLLRSLNKYVILNPNIFGVGININKIIDDTESAAEPKQANK